MKRPSPVFRLTAAGLLLALGLLLPFVFHAVGGMTAGNWFLPMHLPVLLAGLLLGPAYGAALGLLCPLLGSLLFQMPPAWPVMTLMLPELVAAGAAVGWLYRLFRAHTLPAVAGAVLAGRLAYALSLVVVINILGLTVPGVSSAWGAALYTFITSWPGFLVQLVLLPPLLLALKKSGLTNYLSKEKAIA
ncbi:MAG: ECF transporter S component [Oscillospiraceae bacterium]|nr:ECF transporter S component [Oscillospiraceae bacterium]